MLCMLNVHSLNVARLGAIGNRDRRMKAVYVNQARCLQKARWERQRPRRS